jgi:Fe-S-cluster containining protein
MIRKGECNNCGYCCQIISRVELRFTDLSDQPFLAARGISREGFKWVDIHDPCQHHTGSSCVIHNHRPQTCIDFPQSPEEIKGTPCSYWFEDEEGNVLT